jgi:hypothetical protein
MEPRKRALFPEPSQAVRSRARLGSGL